MDARQHHRAFDEPVAARGIHWSIAAQKFCVAIRLLFAFEPDEFADVRD